MSSRPPLTIYVIPWSSVIWGVIGAVLAVSTLVVPGAPLATRVITLGFALVMASLSALVVVKRLARLRIDGEITYRRLFVRLAVPLSSAKAVRVERRLSLHFPTFWDLVVEVQGKDVRMPIAAHYWFGGHLMRRARTIAERLDVPVEDPKGDVWRASRFPPLWLLAAGHDWLLAGLVFAVVTPLAVGFGLLALALR